MTRLALTLPLLALFGCPTVKDGMVYCDDYAASSVTVHVSTEHGEPDAYVVEYSTDGGATFTACDGFDGQYACGYEQAGEITVRAGAEDYEPQEQTVTVGLTEDECHVDTETVDFVLAPIDDDCTDVEFPSVIATVTGSGGESLTGVRVSYRLGDTETSIACEGDGADGEYACGVDQPGTFHITAVADGHAEELVSVDVTGDDCHVTTEHVEIELDWLPD